MKAKITKLKPSLQINRIDTLVGGGMPSPMQFAVSTQAVGGGTIISNPLPGLVNENTYMAFTAQADEGKQFVNWTVNGVPSTDYPLIIKATQDYLVVAYFTAIGSVAKLKAFTTAPVNRGNWYFGDYSGKDNDVRIKGQRVALLSGAQYIQHNSTFNFNSDWIFKIKFKLSSAPVATQTIFSSRVGAGIGIEMTINTTTGMNFYIGGANLATINFNYLALTELKIEKVGNLYSIYINDTFVKSITNASVIVNNNPINIGAQKTTATASTFFIGSIYEYSLSNYFTIKCNHGQGVVMYDFSGNNNHGTIVGAVLSTFWGSTLNDGEPYEHSVGATLYKGDALNNISNNTDWINLVNTFADGYCYYNNDVNNSNIYGNLYNFFVASNPKLTEGSNYRVPSRTDFETLVTYLGGNTVAGGKMKETGLSYWLTPNTGATNESGFSARGAGGRNNGTAVFTTLNTQTYYWTSTAYDVNSSFYLSLLNSNDDTSMVFSWKNNAFSIRLMRDNLLNLPNGTLLLNDYTDGSGNVYNAVVIGSQIWLNANLKTEKYQKGDEILSICGNNNYSITGFNRLGFFSPASGALKGLPNTYTIAGNSEVLAGDYTADQIAAFVNTDLVQVTQNANAVTLIILKQ